VQVQRSGSSYILTMSTRVDAAEIARCIIANQVDMYSMTPRMLSLEEVFVREIEEGQP